MSQSDELSHGSYCPQDAQPSPHHPTKFQLQEAPFSTYGNLLEGLLKLAPLPEFLIYVKNKFSRHGVVAGLGNHT